ncbi:MAG: bifunctional (p)ppGpp synthetase/guanosine-3',5'-bis(diphosphate) 3'-pyrophosphohydrolase [Clostridiales bacterium]|nr:bifunctional (p)ppGpp synthetase/guanosine-3',5'-bis(diphosphate) 3'-pyrophosphohydrolase [Clostridiales bacterium]
MGIPTKEEIIAKVNEYSKKDHSLIEKAYDFAQKAHEGQVRESGDPFFKHPAKVALLLTGFELDDASICGGLLHDVIEDTEYTYEDIKNEFGEEVANLVEGVTKLGRIPYTTKEEQQAENFRKMFMAMAMDIRVIFIKLADRLHNMKTLAYMGKEKQYTKAKETLEIYAPLAHRLGMYSIKWELEDLCLRYIDSDAYNDLVNSISERRATREKFIKKIINEVRVKLDEMGIEAEIEGRPKHFYSIYRKMKEQNKTIDQIFDLFALRVIVDSVKNCYAVLGLVHEMYRPVPGRFKDYIAMPKSNGYQSLHTTLVGESGHPFEIQIRTWDMHKTAEYGVAAHWKYKEKTTTKPIDSFEEKLAWLRQSVEWQKETQDGNQFMESLKLDLFSDDVFVFSPKGEVYQLPVHSTPIDFAYRIHSEIGNKMVGARVNDKITPIGYELKNGDVVEIITSPTSKGPSRDWLNIAKSPNAKAKMMQWFRKERYEENVEQGKEIVEKELKRLKLSFNDLFKPEWLEPLMKKYTFSKIEDFYSAIGYGAVPAGKIIGKLKEEYDKAHKEELTEEEINKNAENAIQNKPRKAPPSGIIVRGIDNCLVRLSKCCNPLPGDEIVGYITRGRGVSVHRSDCPNMNDFVDNVDRLIDVEWYQAVKSAEYVVSIEVLANDRKGLLGDVSNAVSDVKAKINAIAARVMDDRTVLVNMEVQLENVEHLTKTLKAIRKVDSVYEVRRKKG